MPKIGSSGSAAEEEKSASPWQKFTLALVEGNSNSWFESYGLVSTAEWTKSIPGNNLETISIFSALPELDVSLVPKFRVAESDRGEIQEIPNSKLGKAIIKFLEVRDVSMQFKTHWPISHSEQIELDVKQRLEGQWGTEKQTPFIQSLEIYRDSQGELTAYWFVDLLISPVDIENYNSFEFKDDDGLIKTYGIETGSGAWTVGQISTELHIPLFIKQLAYMCETPFPSTQIMTLSRDIAFSNVPEEARPVPFFTIRRKALAQGFSKLLSKLNDSHSYDGSLYPQTIQFGWRITEKSIDYLDEIMPTLVDGCSFAMTIVEDGFDNFRNSDYPAPWDDLLGNPCIHLKGYVPGESRYGAPQWIPNTHIGEITTRTQQLYFEAEDLYERGDREAGRQKLSALLDDGAGPFLVHGANDMLYQYLLPDLVDNHELIDLVELCANDATSHDMHGQSTNAISNLGIGYYIVGDYERSISTFKQALDRPDKFAEAEANYFLSLIYDLKGETRQASMHRERCEAAGGYQAPSWLFGQDARNTITEEEKKTSRSSFCGNCGTKFVNETQNFCSSCGQKRI